MPSRNHDRLQDHVREATCILAGATGIAYLGWRLFFTINPNALGFSLAVWGAEAFGYIATMLFFFVVWNTKSRHAPPRPSEGLSVDVMIPTYNESLWMIRRTVIAALAMEYPHATYILDDSNRNEVATIAREMGCKYIARLTNEHAKAGNLNHAMQQTSGEFIVVFDVDHIPFPEFLQHTMGYFEDPNMAFVQTPQEYYNLDSYEHKTDIPGRKSWSEQSLFYRVIEPGRDRWNAACFCGSGGVLRRSALEDVGGFATETITEDFHTSMRMHARGWDSAFHNEVLALGLSAQTATAFQVMRLRWGQGNMQIVRREGLFGPHGLTLPQRLNYLSSALHYFAGFQRMVLYLTPPLCVATGVVPIRAFYNGYFVALILSYYLTAFVAFRFSGRGYAMFVATERFHMATFLTYIRSCQGLLTRRALRFKVSAKAKTGRSSLGTLLPIALVAAYIVICLIGGTWRLAAGRADNILGFWINVVWTAWSAYLALTALSLMLRKTDFRSVPRAHADLPTRWGRKYAHLSATAFGLIQSNSDPPTTSSQWGRTGGKSGIPAQWRSGEGVGVGVLLDISECGAGVLVSDPVANGSEIAINVMTSDGQLTLAGRVRRNYRIGQGGAIGIEWPEASGPEAIVLARLCGELTIRHYTLVYNRPWDRIGMFDFHRGHRRKSPRKVVSIPVSIRLPGNDWWAVTEDVSTGGALLLSPNPVACEAMIELRPWNKSRGVIARVVRCEELQRPPGHAWRLGLELTEALDVAPPSQRLAPLGSDSALPYGRWAVAAEALSVNTGQDLPDKAPGD